ncbi:beta-N-acetylhexosaminidase [Mangrovibacterium lignilyticum]|uniref:beta-N-acetylhexosaminidase n=1 Tax=Mangrovibacterium lignilyticum TaxID=2668052 RepID=UPI0013D43ABC|nr:beta-N-acetylhexosaminidase [Mangrovibacterium lignilyticum]
MRLRSQFMLLGVFLLMFGACTEKVQTDLAKTAFIPKPVSVTATGRAFDINSSSTVFVHEGADHLVNSAKFLADAIGHLTGSSVAVETVSDAPAKGIYLSLTADDKIPAEGYKLSIGEKLISIEGGDEAGCFYGIQTLLQTLPATITPGEKLIVPTGAVSDAPVYSYRGVMLDVARHFFSVKDVKRFIDFLAEYKMNTLHMHLTDDQGWRIEIKSWPKLIEVGGSTEVGGGKGGFYTQEQYKDIVAYAAEHFITIVPEVDMPGHTNAALASYAELNADGKARDLYTGIDVGFSTFDAHKEVTYKFIDDVVREVSALSPGPYFHLGGDESHATKHDDYVYFVNRVQGIVQKYGKQIIGWDEIANADMVKGAAVQFWADAENTSLGLEKGAKVLVSPASRAYMDMKYDTTTVLGLKWAGTIEVDHAYDWQPDTVVAKLTKEQVLGVEAPLWSETITNLNELEYMVFPRLPGYAEIGWTKNEDRNWDEYKVRLSKFGKRFEAQGVNFYRSPLVPWEE